MVELRGGGGTGCGSCSVMNSLSSFINQRNLSIITVTVITRPALFYPLARGILYSGVFFQIHSGKNME